MRVKWKIWSESTMSEQTGDVISLSTAQREPRRGDAAGVAVGLVLRKACEFNMDCIMDWGRKIDT
jgi:hypothetical protein